MAVMKSVGWLYNFLSDIRVESGVIMRGEEFISLGDSVVVNRVGSTIKRRAIVRPITVVTINIDLAERVNISFEARLVT